MSKKQIWLDSAQCDLLAATINFAIREMELRLGAKFDYGEAKHIDRLALRFSRDQLLIIKQKVTTDETQ